MDLPPAPHLAPLCAHLLGPVRIAVGDRVIPDHAWPRRSARALLLLLLVTPDHRLPRDRVLDLLWPERAPTSAHRALRVALHALRRVLEPHLGAGRESAYVESRGDSVALRSGIALWIDIDVFEVALTKAGSAALADRPAMLHQALALFGGDLLEDEPYTAGRRTVASGYGGPGAGQCWTSLSLNWNGAPSGRFPYLRSC